MLQNEFNAIDQAALLNIYIVEELIQIEMERRNTHLGKGEIYTWISSFVTD